jgi:hypothetical protein
MSVSPKHLRGDRKSVFPQLHIVAAGSAALGGLPYAGPAGKQGTVSEPNFWHEPLPLFGGSSGRTKNHGQPSSRSKLRSEMVLCSHDPLGDL